MMKCNPPDSYIKIFFKPSSVYRVRYTGVRCIGVREQNRLVLFSALVENDSGLLFTSFLFRL